MTESVVSDARQLRLALKNSMAEFRFLPVPGTGGTTFRKTFNDETTLRVSLQILFRRKPLLGLFPRIGFINSIIENFVAGLWTTPKGPKDRGPTLSATLGYLCPHPHDDVEWYFDATADACRENATVAVQRVLEYGMPVMTRYPTVASLVAWAEAPIADLDAGIRSHLLRAVIFHLIGHDAKAKEVLLKMFSDAAAEGREMDDPGFEPELALLGRLKSGRAT